MSGPAVVYRAYAGGEILLYVGLTGDLHKRVRFHEYRTMWWHQVSHVRCDWYPSREVAADVERKLIAQLRPRYNKPDRVAVGRENRRARLLERAMAS